MSAIVGVLIAIVFTWIGVETWRLRGTVNKICGALIVVIAGVILTFGFAFNDGGEFKRLDHEECVQYAWLDEEWKCVPVEEAG